MQTLEVKLKVCLNVFSLAARNQSCVFFNFNKVNHKVCSARLSYLDWIKTSLWYYKEL